MPPTSINGVEGPMKTFGMSDGNFFFTSTALDSSAPLYRVPASGGTPALVRSDVINFWDDGSSLILELENGLARLPSSGAEPSPLPGTKFLLASAELTEGTLVIPSVDNQTETIVAHDVESGAEKTLFSVPTEKFSTGNVTILDGHVYTLAGADGEPAQLMWAPIDGGAPKELKLDMTLDDLEIVAAGQDDRLLVMGTVSGDVWSRLYWVSVNDGKLQVIDGLELPAAFPFISGVASSKTGVAVIAASGIYWLATGGTEAKLAGCGNFHYGAAVDDSYVYTDAYQNEGEKNAIYRFPIPK
jgi:hypothetical protein